VDESGARTKPPEARQKGHLASAAGKMEREVGSRPTKWSGGRTRVAKYSPRIEVCTKLKAHSGTTTHGEDRARVTDVTRAAFACGHERETLEHVTVFCPLYQDTREQLRVKGLLLLTTVEGVKSSRGAS
jgi:hypothetical protein